MSETVLALILGTVLAVGALAFVLYPLFFDREKDSLPTTTVPVRVITDDEIEARVRAYRQARRECPRCGLRPEPDALYCSTCGDALGDASAD